MKTATTHCELYNKRTEKQMNDFVTLAHGAGGKQTSELIDKVFKAH